MVREDRGEEEQHSVTTTEAPGREPGPGRRERRVAQPKNGHGRPTGPRGARAKTPGLLRTVRRDEKIHGHRNRDDRICGRFFDHQVFHLNW